MGHGHLVRLSDQLDLQSLLGVELVGVAVLQPGWKYQNWNLCILIQVPKPLTVLLEHLKEDK